MAVTERVTSKSWQLLNQCFHLLHQKFEIPCHRAIVIVQNRWFFTIQSVSEIVLFQYCCQDLAIV